MSTRLKFVLTYVAGIVTGIILVFAFSFYVTMNHNNSDASDDAGVELFNNPKQEIKAEEFKVMQVLPNGSALAAYDKIDHDDDAPEYGTVVLFQASGVTSFYDDQIITLPKGKHFRQIGTYRYETRNGVEKTVPVIGILDN